MRERALFPVFLCGSGKGGLERETSCKVMQRITREIGYGYRVQENITVVHKRKKILFKIYISFLMVITGAMNTLSVKWADTISAKGTNPRSEHLFIHPFIQTLAMFTGEASCLVVFMIFYYYHKLVLKKSDCVMIQKFGRTSLMYIGLNLTSASSFQMLRGSIIIFTALMSVAFFGCKLQVYHWAGMLIVVIGLTVIEIGDLIGDNSSGDPHSALTGDLLIVIAQIIAAIQMITEHKLVKGYNVPPLQGVGLEGIFGIVIVGAVLAPMYYTPWHLPSGRDFWQDCVRFEDIMDGFNQLFYIPTLSVALFGSICSIAVFNYAGLAVTKEENATARMVLDTSRSIFIWMIGLLLKWVKFDIYHPIGFVCLTIGICIFYNMIFSQIMKKLNIWPAICGVSDEERSRIPTDIIK